MILSNVSIHNALDKKWLIIDPEPQPRSKTGPEKCPYQTSSVDLTLGNEIAYFKQGLAINIDLRRGDFARLFGPNSENRRSLRSSHIRWNRRSWCLQRQGNESSFRSSATRLAWLQGWKERVLTRVVAYSCISQRRRFMRGLLEPWRWK